MTVTDRTEQHDLVGETCAGCGATGVHYQETDAPPGWTHEGDVYRCPKCSIAHAPTDPAPATPRDIACPLRDGLHGWIWPGGHARGTTRAEGWRSAREQADRAVALGLAGVIPQNGIEAAKWLQGRDPGDALPRVEVFQRAGLQVTAGIGMDGAAATIDAIVRFHVDALDMPGVCIMGDEEKQSWETPEGRARARAIVAAVVTIRPHAPERSVFCPWWKPEVHSGAPDREFWALYHHLFTQDYGAQGADAHDDGTLAMLAHSRIAYPPRGISADHVHLAFQLYAHSIANAGRIVLSGERVACAWDLEEMDLHMHLALIARKQLVALGFPASTAGLRAFQTQAGIGVDGTLGPVTLHDLGVDKIVGALT